MAAIGQLRLSPIENNTYCISVNLMCQGGYPWSSKGVLSWYKGNRGWTIMKSGDDTPLSTVKKGHKRQIRMSDGPHLLKGHQDHLW